MDGLRTRFLEIQAMFGTPELTQCLMFETEVVRSIKSVALSHGL